MDFMFPRKSLSATTISQFFETTLSDDKVELSFMPSNVSGILPFVESLFMPVFDALDTSVNDEIVMKHLPKSPSFNDLQLKVGGFMMNSISTLNLPRKLPRNFEYVGGMQMERKESQIIQEVRNLPKLSMFPCSFSMQFTHRKYCTSYRNQMTV